MNPHRRQRGDVPLGCLVGFVVAVLVAVIAIKVVPVMVNVGEFDKEIKANAERANNFGYTDKRIRANIVAKADELDIPIHSKSVWIKRSATRIKIRVSYDYPIEFPGYTYVWQKVHEVERIIFSG
jgi:hypothetical protein